MKSKNSCRDTIENLRQLARSEKPEWDIRLAAALLEGQERHRKASELCEHLWEAKKILIKHAGTMIQAQEQIQRVEPLLEHCSN